MTASTTDLQAWAGNFSQLRAEVDEYEAMADEAARVDPRAASRRGVGQLIGFQLGTLLRMSLPLVAQYGTPPPTEPVPGAEHVQLMGRYMLELTELQIDSVPFGEARRRLESLSDRLGDAAARWAASGVDAGELEQFAAESRVLAAKAQAASDE